MNDDQQKIDKKETSEEPVEKQTENTGKQIEAKTKEEIEKSADEKSEGQINKKTGEPVEQKTDEETKEQVENKGEKQPPKKRKKEKNEKRMPFLDHLEELRWCLIRSFIGIGAAAIGASLFASRILDFLMRPYRLLPEEMRLAPMQYLSPAGGFMMHIKVVVFAGLLIALPYVFYEIWKFIVPGLLGKEKKFAPLVIIATTFCFSSGAAFAFMIILPLGLRFLFRFQTEWMVANLRIEDYLSFVTRVILAFGVVFELPVLSFILTKIGVLTPQFMSSKRRYGIVMVFIIAAILTPPDPLTQIMMATPLLVLYEISILVSKIVVGKEDKSSKEKKSSSKKKK